MTAACNGSTPSGTGVRCAVGHCGVFRVAAAGRGGKHQLADAQTAPGTRFDYPSDHFDPRCEREGRFHLVATGDGEDVGEVDTGCQNFDKRFFWAWSRSGRALIKVQDFPVITVFADTPRSHAATLSGGTPGRPAVNLMRCCCVY